MVSQSCMVHKAKTQDKRRTEAGMMTQSSKPNLCALEHALIISLLPVIMKISVMAKLIPTINCGPRVSSDRFGGNSIGGALGLPKRPLRISMSCWLAGGWPK